MEIKNNEDSLDSISKGDSGRNSTLRNNKKNVVETRASSKKTNPSNFFRKSMFILLKFNI